MKDRKTPAIVKVYELALTYETELKDQELQEYSITLLEKINKILQKEFLLNLPQIQVQPTDKTKKSLKIGVTPIELDELDEED